MSQQYQGGERHKLQQIVLYSLLIFVPQYFIAKMSVNYLDVFLSVESITLYIFRGIA